MRILAAVGERRRFMPLATFIQDHSHDGASLIMKNLAIIIVLALVGAGAAYGYIRWNAAKNNHSGQTEKHSPDDGHDHGTDVQSVAAETGGAEAAALCSTHRIPEKIDAFCHPELIEKMGHCGEHDVPEAFCTRCSPVLIAAFKAENDWCAEHSVPESQCAACKGG